MNESLEEPDVAFVQLRTAYEQAADAPIAEVTTYVQSLLGQQWTAYLARALDPDAVEIWARGIAKPPLDSERRLRDSYRIALLISAVDDNETARVWFGGMNPILDHRAPVWVIANLPDGSERAMDAALAFVAYG